MAVESEHYLWRGVLARAFLDFVEEKGRYADHKWFGSSDFSQVCTLADVKEGEILYIHRLIRNNNLEKEKILKIIKYLKLEKEKEIEDVQIELESTI